MRVLADSPGLSAAEIAQTLGVPTAAVQRPLYRSLTSFVARDWNHRWYLREQLHDDTIPYPTDREIRETLIPPEVTARETSDRDNAHLATSGSGSKVSGERARVDAVSLIEALLRAASEFAGAHSIHEAIQSDLAGLATSLGLSEQLGAIPIDTVVQHPGFLQELASDADAVVGELSDRDLLVLQRRVLSSSPPTLEALGRELGITRERARQLQVRATDKLTARMRPKIDRVGDVVRSRLGHVVAQATIDRKVKDLFIDERRPGTALARRMMVMTLGYSVVDGIGMDRDALDVVAELKDGSRRLADSVGLVDEDQLRKTVPDTEWTKHWDALIQRAGLHRVLGYLALRDTNKARIKAAILSIGRPATREEIGDLVGADPGRLGAQLSGIPGIARAGKRRWGLEEWIEDVYEGIPGEIVQRINEDGGATTLVRLVEELPRLFEVSEASIRAHVATPQFTLRDGYVSLADPSTIRYRDLEDVIDGRDERGAPYWAFKVKDQFLSGYSLLGFPPELARELGCGPNEKISATLLAPAGCEPLSVIWRMSSVNGASVGFLAEPLRRLNAAVGDHVALVLVGDGAVELRIGPANEGRHLSETADGLLEQLKKRRQVL